MTKQERKTVGTDPETDSVAQEKKGYHGLNDSERAEWAGKSARHTSDHLVIDGHPVMERWEASLQDVFISVVNSQRVVLEVGFGMGISAGLIARSEAVREHHIIEFNQEVYQNLLSFQKQHPKVVPHRGDALQVIKKMPDERFDGIYYDAYPLHSSEQHTHHFGFLKEARSKLKTGGWLTYCNLTSFGVLRHRYDSWESFFRDTQLPHLEKAGYSSDEVKELRIVDVQPDKDCRYYQLKTALVPVIQKESHQAAPASP